MGKMATGSTIYHITLLLHRKRALPKFQLCMEHLQKTFECLHQDPVVLADLCGLLATFRKKRIGIIPDIEKMLPQVGMHQADCDVTRYLWLKYMSGKVTEGNTEIIRFATLLFGVISNLSFLVASVEHHLDETNTETAKQINDIIYVDNVIMGTKNPKKSSKMRQ